MSTSTPACLNQPLSMAICQGVQPGQSEKPILSGVSALAAVKAEPSMSAAAVKRVVNLYARFMKTSQITLEFLQIVAQQLLLIFCTREAEPLQFRHQPIRHFDQIAPANAQDRCGNQEAVTADLLHHFAHPRGDRFR